jgi:hypothetical protein
MADHEDLSDEELEYLAKLRGYSLQRPRRFKNWSCKVDETALNQFHAAIDTQRDQSGAKLTVQEALSQALEQWAARQKKAP